MNITAKTAYIWGGTVKAGNEKKVTNLVKDSRLKQVEQNIPEKDGESGFDGKDGEPGEKSYHYIY